jgi:predicted nucleic acid-binding protein
MSTVDANVWIAAFDPTDYFNEASAAFFQEIARRRALVHGPDFVLIEVACALTRRLRDSAIGANAVAEIRAHPLIQLHPLDDLLLQDALQLGMSYSLRGADALYVATAQLAGGVLVSWDKELVQRAGALTPTDWLAANP